MGRASGGSDTSYWLRNDVHNFQGATPVIVSILTFSKQSLNLFSQSQ